LKRSGRQGNRANKVYRKDGFPAGRWEDRNTFQGIIMGMINLVQGFNGDGTRGVSLGIIKILFGIILLGRPLVAASVLPIIIIYAGQ
jgi:hypothetical protein